MPITPPTFRRPDRSAGGPLEHEIAQEKAAALGRLGRGLERALAALAAFDAEHPEARCSEESRSLRTALVESAGHALWLFIVQRDACGLRDARTVIARLSGSRRGAGAGRRLPPSPVPARLIAPICRTSHAGCARRGSQDGHVLSQAYVGLSFTWLATSDPRSR